ncbi:acyl carrier protein [Streptomyces sp. ICBB 8177]|uniref:acyl carrier protein n=1 Tax=Streptomyces sp. ICBB 8177 TaxID=563922 RepID=UPI000D684E5A|nr:acyl carrier protein [Streptomyces sp. ICBB 8177]PWI44819.1 phosphopantetheine-binding protein [Streptomyces sp. ICBB 8177]
MERAEVIEHLRNSLSVVLDRPLPEFNAETRILEDLGLDSMRFIELLMSLEDTIGLEVDPESLEPEVFRDAGSLADHIRTRLDPAHASA